MILNPISLGGTGLAFILIGLGLCVFRLLFRKALAFRNDYAAKLNDDGHYERAKKLNTDTEIIIRRVPVYGMVFVGIGACLIMGAFLSQK
jgi:hypothetical protein